MHFQILLYSNYHFNLYRNQNIINLQTFALFDHVKINSMCFSSKLIIFLIIYKLFIINIFFSKNKKFISKE